MMRIRWGRRKAAERELEEELQFHLEQAAAKSGSRRQAEAALGGVEAIKEECREERAGAWLATVGQDFRLGLRALRRSPGFACAAVITLALCIGANTAVFSILDAALLQTPPFPHAERLVALLSTSLHGQVSRGEPIWAGDYAAIRDGASAFQNLAAMDSRSYNLTGPAAAEHVAGTAVTANFFSVLGVAPAQGRTFLPGEDQAGHEHVAVLSDALWHGHFAGAPMLGKSVQLDGAAYTVVGIMPPGFAHGVYSAALWVPLTISAAQLQHTRAATLTVFSIGRLRPGATVAQAAQQVGAIAQRIAQEYPVEHGMGETVHSLRQYLTTDDNNPPALWFLMILVALVLAIGCIHVAGLNLGRAAARNEEMQIRRALGAGRMRLARQVLTESAAPAVLAAGAGLLLGWLGMDWLNLHSSGLGAHFDARVLAFTMAAAAWTTLVSGLPPALQSSSLPRAGARQARHWGRDALVAVVVGFTAACLVASASVYQVVRQELQSPLGFQPGQVLAANLDLSGPDYATAAQQTRTIQQLTAAIGAIPGARAAALVSPGALHWDEDAVATRGQQPSRPSDGNLLPKVFGITAGYFTTLRVPLVAGRAFTRADAPGAAPVAIVSRSAARRLFPHAATAVGQFIRIEDRQDETWREVVGESDDIASYTGDTSHNGEVFEPLAQAPRSNLGIVVRTAGAPDAAAAGLRQAIEKIDPALALYGVEPLVTALNRHGAAGDLAFVQILGALGALALLLTAIGLYSVVAYAAARRRREIGIRMALGAQEAQIERMLLGRMLKLAASGLAGGLLLGWLGLVALVVAADGGVGELQTHGVLLFGAPALLLLAVTLTASYLPARRAARAEPMGVLKEQ